MTFHLFKIVDVDPDYPPTAAELEPEPRPTQPLPPEIAELFQPGPAVEGEGPAF